jgi:hypothetical protein
VLSKLRSLDKGDESVHDLLGRSESEVPVKKRLQDIFGGFGKIGQTVKSATIWFVDGIEVMLHIELGLFQRVCSYSKTDAVDDIEG